MERKGMYLIYTKNKNTFRIAHLVSGLPQKYDFSLCNWGKFSYILIIQLNYICLSHF